MTVTGKLGDVMQELVQAANAYVRSRANSFGIKPMMFEKRDIHVHVPEGATPKDGPSAGVGMITSIVSALTGVAVRKEVAMTGEISLRGRVMPIGGLKEKLLAALRGGLKTVLIPKENERDLPEIPDNVKKGLEIVPVVDGRRGAGPRAGQAAGRHRMAERSGAGRAGQAGRGRGSRPGPLNGLETDKRSPGAIRGFVAFGRYLCGFGAAVPTKYGIRR